ncbi:MAG: right-handed parallel beta-helix repeat-containing protein [Kiritimatiellales bacterium]
MTFLFAGLIYCVVHAEPPRVHTDYYVSPNGNDAADGSISSPFATLQRVRDAVRELKTEQSNLDIQVLLRGGYYALTNTVVFGTEDSALDGHQITYAAYPGEKPVFGAGVPVTGWTRVPANLPGMPPEAIGKLWRAPVPEGLESCTVLFRGKDLLPRACSGSFVPADKGTTTVIHFPAGVLPPDAAERGLNLRIMPSNPWVMNLLSIQAVDSNGLTATVSVPATYRLGPLPAWAYYKKASAWIENAIEFMTASGQWVLDKQTGTFYLWHEGDVPPSDIFAPCLTELVRIEGEIDYDGPQDIPVKGLVFRGLTFTHSDFRRWSAEKPGWGLQHDWEMFDSPTAMLRFRGAEDCAVEHCEFVGSGSTAIRCDLHVQRIRIENNEIHHVGGVGILFAGYGPGTKDVNRGNVIRSNCIHQIGEVLWGSPGIFVWQSGHNQIVSNCVSHLPYAGIAVTCRAKWSRTVVEECGRTIRWNEIDAATGNASQNPAWAADRSLQSWLLREPFMHARENVVEYNNVSDCMRRLEDGDAIYISGAGTGNRVQYNWIHDIDSPRLGSAVRCDDDQYRTVIANNIISDCSCFGITIKGANTVTNNILYNLRSKTVSGEVRPHNRGYLSLPYGNCTGAVIQRNIFYALDTKVPLMTEAVVLRLGEARLRQCDADSNVYFNRYDSEWGARHLLEQQQYGIETHSLSADPLFKNPADGDFSLKENSPALELGFVPIDTHRIVRCREFH